MAKYSIMQIANEFKRYGVYITYVFGSEVKDYFRKGDIFDDFEEFVYACQELRSELDCSVEIEPEEDGLDYKMVFKGLFSQSVYFRILMSYNSAYAGEIESMVN
jgi:hypothetical protein